MRLTKKELMDAINQPMCFGSLLVGKKMFAQIIKELCEYKDIESELGIDLITLFKALKNGVYYKYKDMGVEKISKKRPITIHQNTVVCDYHTYKYFKDYGKIWALTKEELQ